MKIKNMAIAFSAMTAAVLLSTTALAASFSGGSVSQNSSANTTSSVTSKAAPDTTSSKGSSGPIDLSKMTAEQKAELRAILSKKLMGLVAIGKITQEKADRILADFDKGIFAPHARKDGKRAPIDLSKMTAEQKAALRANLSSKLAKKVASGEMTQAQVDQILADFDKGIFAPHMTRDSHKQHKPHDTQSAASKAS